MNERNLASPTSSQEVLEKAAVVLRFSQVGFSYGSLAVLADVHFHIHEGEFIAMVGPNGSGKTTLLKLILGLEQPSGGTVELFGQNPRYARNQIGYVPQHVTYDPTFPITVGEVVRMGMVRSTSFRKKPKDDPQTLRALAQVELSDLVDRPYSALSGGQRRRVLVARALVANPRMLILDEPTANMDSESETRLFATLGELKKKTTILIVTHDMSMVSSLTDRVFCIGGHHLSGTSAHTVVQHVLEPADAPEDLYGGKVLRVLHQVELSADMCENPQKGALDD
ncbi:metal ABC transporter ATP-binding protein [uncultured Sphaerochaeta sp.]|uniref:metal ABC transporter ATP-binding protein n=1 Tax=uncultured Sphaerochaeta sp. TaxID=886478 RepID=UPI002A0A3576|nr:metal ABC transporter ATP-binding protein [uncultured Sphaerochaeta sp.]